MEWLLPRLSGNPGTAFELGANMGAALSLLQRAGWSVHGADYGRAHIEAGRDISGVPNLLVGGIDQLEALGIRPNLFVLQHVLEHFADIGSQLERIRALLAPEGLLYIEVAGVYGWLVERWRGDLLLYLQNADMYHFSLSTLDDVMGRSGFERSAGDEHIHGLYRVTRTPRVDTQRDSTEAARVEDHLRRLERRQTPKLAMSWASRTLGISTSIAVARRGVALLRQKR